MFFTEQLNVIPHLLIGQEWSEDVQKTISKEYLNLEATLLRAKVLREFSKSKLIYILQSHIQSKSSDLAYLFLPFIFANLNKRTIYATPATDSVLTVLNKYYQSEKQVNISIENALNDLSVYLDLLDVKEKNQEFFYINLMKALCRTDISTLFLITEYEIDQDKLKSLAEFLKIDIYLISSAIEREILDSGSINMRKLLFKNKDEEHSSLCTLFSHLNAEILTKTETLNPIQAKDFIEDMFYAEHIYEKLSVYAEYVQTQIQHLKTN